MHARHTSDAGAVASSTVWQLASQLAMAALSILTVKFVTIGLTKELVGHYNSAYGYLQLFGILADFGLYAVAVREVARSDRKEEVLGALIVIRFAILVLSLGSALTFAWLLPMWHGTPLPAAVSIAALVPFFTLLAGIIRTVFQVRYTMQYVFLAEVTQRIITAGAIGIIVMTGVRGSADRGLLHAFLLIGGIGALVLFLISYACGSRFMRIRPRFDRKDIFLLLRKSAPYGIAFLCVALYRQFDVTLIALLRPDFDLQNAYYGTVVRMADMGFLLPTFLLNSTLPILSERDAQGHDTAPLLGKTLLILLFLGSISALFAFFWARPLVLLLTTSAYLSTPGQPGSDTALALLSIPLFLNGFVQYGFYVLLTKHQWKKLVSMLLLGAGVSLACNIVLIPLHGFTGAAVTSIVVHALLAVLLLRQGLLAAPVRLSMASMRQWFLFSILLGGALFAMRPLLTGELSTLAGLTIATCWMGILAGLLGLHRIFLQPKTV